MNSSGDYGIAPPGPRAQQHVLQCDSPPAGPAPAKHQPSALRKRPCSMTALLPGKPPPNITPQPCCSDPAA